MAKSTEQEERAAEIGARIVQARQEAGGMKQRELAELLHVSERSMQAYESGEVVPYRHLRELERILGRPMAWFLYGEEGIKAPGATLDDVVALLRDDVIPAITALGRKVEKLSRG